MSNYFNRLNSGRIIAYLRPRQIASGRWAIEVKRFNCEAWELNISLPIFRDKESAEKWLSDNYETDPA